MLPHRELSAGGGQGAYEIISSKRVLVFIMNITDAPCQAPLLLKLKGLDPDRQHRDTSTDILTMGAH